MSNQKPRSSSRSPKAESKSMVLNSPSDNNPNMKTKLCRHWKRGQCTFSEGCRFAHGAKELRGSAEVFKTSICRFWLMDACVAGTRCRHAHGEHELRDRTADATEIRDSTSPLEATPSVWNTYSSHHDNSPPHQNLSYNHSNGSPTNAVSPTSQSSLKARPNATNDPATTKTAKRMPLSLPSLPVTLHAPVADQTSSFAREEKSTQESAAATGGSLRLPLSSKRNEQLKISVSGLLEEDETTRSTSEEVAYNKRIDLSLPPTNTNHPHVHHVNPYDSSAAYPLHTPSASFSSPHPSSYYKLQSSHPQPKLANHAPFPFSPSSAKHTPHHLLSSPVASPSFCDHLTTPLHNSSHSYHHQLMHMFVSQPNPPLLPDAPAPLLLASNDCASPNNHNSWAVPSPSNHAYWTQQQSSSVYQPHLPSPSHHLTYHNNSNPNLETPPGIPLPLGSAAPPPLDDTGVSAVSSLLLNDDRSPLHHATELYSLHNTLSSNKGETQWSDGRVKSLTTTAAQVATRRRLEQGGSSRFYLD
eukprot:GDKJ01023431.1.p1 GENE.GDKJ01023431.1~~GDKJ01023431.1.p1  ORF type:complete len:528 (+),score=146.34 GDKJ01023431.1:41-1624(+)